MAFPLSLETLKPLFTGLRCRLAERNVVPGGLSRRAPDRVFLALGGNGVASGDGDITLAFESKLTEPARFWGESGDGERGELGEGDADLDVISRNVGPLDGDLESERLNCANAGLESTW